MLKSKVNPNHANYFAQSSRPRLATTTAAAATVDRGPEAVAWLGVHGVREREDRASARRIRIRATEHCFPWVGDCSTVPRPDNRIVVLLLCAARELVEYTTLRAKIDPDHPLVVFPAVHERFREVARSPHVIFQLVVVDRDGKRKLDVLQLVVRCKRVLDCLGGSQALFEF